MLLASNLQLQSHLPGATQHHWRFPARSRANVSLPHSRCKPAYQQGIAGSHQIDQCSRSADNGDMKPNFRYSLVRILSTLSSKRSPIVAFVLPFELQIELLLQSCALFVNNFPRSRRETAETDTQLQRPREPHYPKNTRFGTKECYVFTWIHTFPSLCTYRDTSCELNVCPFEQNKA